ncbi:GNAT family N-acetyltransferase [Chitinophaga sp. Cy-1792]|uniref:GNAT family N-acetyltransferase n=1 Tax=Chitinophaga sp. Cy-1792 TaxID=2608339 RepID=UPI0014218C10|nr:N-acetyltransferase [Chitinophaga sp. Cy-1792]NIG57398.1 N-acetyltransferase [Chitinophaga sp. Cy-1792]
MKDFEIIDNKEARQFEAHISGLTAKVIYERNGSRIFLTGAEVPPTLEKQGVMPMLLGKVMEQIQAQNIRMVPSSKKVAEFVRSNPRWKTLLAHGLHI